MSIESYLPVSYTHLDVYKRQVRRLRPLFVAYCSPPLLPAPVVESAAGPVKSIPGTELEGEDARTPVLFFGRSFRRPGFYALTRIADWLAPSTLVVHVSAADP